MKTHAIVAIASAIVMGVVSAYVGWHVYMLGTEDAYHDGFRAGMRARELQVCIPSTVPGTIPPLPENATPKIVVQYPEER